jgi:hypothetical protein
MFAACRLSELFLDINVPAGENMHTGMLMIDADLVPFVI